MESFLEVFAFEQRISDLQQSEEPENSISECLWRLKYSFFIFVQLWSPLILIHLWLVQHYTSPNHLKRSQLILLIQYLHFLYFLGKQTVKFEVQLTSKAFFELFLNEVQQVEFMHEFQSCHFAIRGTVKSLLEYCKLAQFDFIFTPQKQTKIVAHLDLSQHFVHVSLILILSCYFFHSVDSSHIFVEGLVSDTVVVSEDCFLVELYVFVDDLVDEGWI